MSPLDFLPLAIKNRPQGAILPTLRNIGVNQSVFGDSHGKYSSVRETLLSSSCRNLYLAPIYQILDISDGR